MAGIVDFLFKYPIYMATGGVLALMVVSLYFFFIRYILKLIFLSRYK